MSDVTSETTVPAAPPGVWRLLGRSAGARLLVLPVSALLGIVNTRLIIQHFGQGAYVQYGLLVNISTLIQFTDLGVSAAVMNAVAESDDPAGDPRVRRVLVTAMRVLLGSAVVLLVITGVISWRHGWPTLLGSGLLPGTGATAAALCAVVIAISLPVGVGQRLLTGLGRNHVSITVLGLQTPIVLLALIVMVSGNVGSSTAVAVIPYVATFGLAAVCTVIGARGVRGNFGAAVRDVPRVRRVRGEQVMDVAWPMLVIMIALPVAMQTDRLVLSHVSTQASLAQYNLAAQMYAPVYALTTSAGMALWPIFARARSRRDATASPHRLAVAFAGVAAGVCLAITVVAPWLAARASDGQVHLSLALLVWFAVLMVLQAAKYPFGMYLTDARGLRFQALTVLAFLPVNLGLSILLAHPYGATGPVIGSAVGVLLSQVIASWVYVRRREARAAHEAAGPA